MPLKLQEADTEADLLAIAQAMIEAYEQKVVDVETGRIAAGALWSICRENPFTKPKTITAPWFPEDSREYAEEALKMHAKPRSQIAQRPHIYLFIIFTHHEYRRQGAAQQIMDWGTRKADELGLEMFLDSSSMAKPLYELNGFVAVQDNLVHPQKSDPDEKWKEMERAVGPFTLTVMWRPVGGKYEERKTRKPWESA
ncbi:hypothetical protein F4818DRAFT_437663 [Hypoxylon cercidicola]|nr:hypothetical protein F4818DRAFT_437663 [Hypoxylon cercidicola]